MTAFMGLRTKNTWLLENIFQTYILLSEVQTKPQTLTSLVTRKKCVKCSNILLNLDPVNPERKYASLVPAKII